MVLYTLAIKGEPVSPDAQINVDKKEVNIFDEEQLEEEFLCEINPYGQVSSMT
jgi:hypothetical protein